MKQGPACGMRPSANAASRRRESYRTTALVEEAASA